MIVVKGITKGEVKVKNKGEYKDLPWSLSDILPGINSGGSF